MTQLSLLDTDAVPAPEFPLVATDNTPVVLEKARPVSVLDKVRALVQEKTRFEPEDISAVTESDTLQDYALVATHSLEARFESRVIDGFFERTTSDVACSDAWQVDIQAEAQTALRLQLAGQRMETQLRSRDAQYDEIPDGLYLPHASKNWHLATCAGCHGDGRVQCHHCHGRKSETCYHCNGARTVTCSAYSCNGSGKINCSVCSGSGQLQESTTEYVTVNVPVTTYENGNSHTSYRSETQPVHGTRSVTCHSCSYGKITCYTCSGSGHNNCGTCHASGSISCRTCAGRGDVTCGPCSGSGKRGNAAWVDVYATQQYAITLPDDADADARAIAAGNDVAAIAALSQVVKLGKIKFDNLDAPATVSARYQGKLRTVRLDAVCNDSHHHIVAYGTDLRWLTLDNIVEKLLRGDLQALATALNRSADDSALSSSVVALLAPLRDVAASELNAEVIEAVLDGAVDHGYSAILSPDYVDQVRTCVLGALRHVYTRLARRFWWQSALAALAVCSVVWLFSGALWGVLAGLLAAGAGFLLFGRRVRLVLTDAFGDASRAARAIAIAGKGKRNRYAHALVLAPAIAGVLVLGHFLPQRGLLARSQVVATTTAAAATAAAATTIATQAPSGSYADAVKLYANGEGDKVAARALLAKLADSGDSAAYGLYGWLVLFGHGAAPTPDQTPGQRQAQLLEAKGWIDKGLGGNDPWALAARGMMLAEGWSEPRDMGRALDYLKQSAAQDHLLAMHFLGLYNVQGYQMPKPNYAEARKWFGKAADKGRAVDIYNLGYMDWNGAGIRKPDRASALKRFRTAAALGEERAQRALAQGHP